jgi:hypothetical protein
MITKASLISKKHGFLASEMDDGLAMMSIENSAYYAMDKIGKSIWQAFEEPTTIHDICSVLCAKYEVSEEQCLEDVIHYIEQLNKSGLISIST